MIISLLTDFGGAEEWVAAMKGVIRGIAPDVELLDVAHDIPPFELGKAALVLAAGVRYLPVGVHVAVVDPGVGTARRALAVRAARGDCLVGPDNGILQPAAERLGGITAAVDIKNPEYMREPAHPTFHGRDIFAPAAAHLARGVELENLGPPIDPASLAPAPYAPALAGRDALYCRIIDIDRFGSLRLNATWEELENAGLAAEDALQADIDEILYYCPLRATFAGAAGGLFLYQDSSGQVGLAADRARAADITGARPGTAVIIYRPQS